MTSIKSFVALVSRTFSHVLRLCCSPIIWSACACVTILIGLVSSKASHATFFPSMMAPLWVIVAFVDNFWHRR